jgi:excisionase family DNA binding protein
MSSRQEQAKAMAARGWLTVAAAAEKLRVSTATVYRQVEEGTIATTKVVGRTYLAEADVNRLAGPLAGADAT